MARFLALVAIAVLGGPPVAAAQVDAFSAAEQSLASARVINPEGEIIGTIAFVETPNGLLIQPDVEGLPPGLHGMHIHENGVCEPPHFRSVGLIFDRFDASHGYLDAEGARAGDLPNAYVGAEGRLQGHIFAPWLSLVAGELPLFPSEDGVSIVIHESLDDYTTDPVGAAGLPIACGVIELFAAE